MNLTLGLLTKQLRRDLSIEFDAENDIIPLYRKKSDAEVRAEIYYVIQQLVNTMDLQVKWQKSDKNESFEEFLNNLVLNKEVVERLCTVLRKYGVVFDLTMANRIEALAVLHGIDLKAGKSIAA